MLSQFASASFNGPILTKTTSAGHVSPGYRTYTSCEIYHNKIVLTLSAEGAKSRQEQPIILSGVTNLIELAADGLIKEESAPTDGPALVYKAVKILPDDRTQEVDLGSYTGENGIETKNESSAARGLRSLLDMNCKQ